MRVKRIFGHKLSNNFKIRKDDHYLGRIFNKKRNFITYKDKLKIKFIKLLMKEKDLKRFHSII